LKTSSSQPKQIEIRLKHGNDSSLLYLRVGRHDIIPTIRDLSQAIPSLIEEVAEPKEGPGRDDHAPQPSIKTEQAGSSESNGSGASQIIGNTDSAPTDPKGKFKDRYNLSNILTVPPSDTARACPEYLQEPILLYVRRRVLELTEGREEVSDIVCEIFEDRFYKGSKGEFLLAEEVARANQRLKELRTLENQANALETAPQERNVNSLLLDSSQDELAKMAQTETTLTATQKSQSTKHNISIYRWAILAVCLCVIALAVSQLISLTRTVSPLPLEGKYVIALLPNKSAHAKSLNTLLIERVQALTLAAPRSSIMCLDLRNRDDLSEKEFSDMMNSSRPECLLWPRLDENGEEGSFIFGGLVREADGVHYMSSRYTRPRKTLDKFDELDTLAKMVVGNAIAIEAEGYQRRSKINEALQLLASAKALDTSYSDVAWFACTDADLRASQKGFADAIQAINQLAEVESDGEKVDQLDPNLRPDLIKANALLELNAIPDAFTTLTRRRIVSESLLAYAYDKKLWFVWPIPELVLCPRSYASGMAIIMKTDHGAFICLRGPSLTWEQLVSSDGKQTPFVKNVLSGLAIIRHKFKGGGVFLANLSTWIGLGKEKIILQTVLPVKSNQMGL